MGFLYSQLFITPPIPITDLTGQALIITGSNTGLGYAAVVHIARLKPKLLVLAVRDLEKGNAARVKILTEADVDSSITEIEVWELNMSNFASVLAFSDRCAKLDRLDGISLNAGVQMHKFELVEGFESTIAINVISTFWLAVALLPVLRRSAEKFDITPRLSIVGSETHAWASWPEKRTPEGQSILEVMSQEVPVSAARYMDNIGREDTPRIMHVMRWFLARTQEVGGRPIAAGLIAGLEKNGQYMHDGIVDDGALSSYVKSKEGEAMGERLWKELQAVFEGVRPGLTASL